MSEESKGKKKAQVLSKLDPVETIEINGVPIEIRPLRHGKVCEAINFLWETFDNISTGKVSLEWFQKNIDKINRYINECMTFPDAPDIQAEDLTEAVLAKVLKVFIIQTLSPGNWKTLAQELQEELGLTIVLSQGLSQKP